MEDKCSILSDIDVQLDVMDMHMDPFYMLDVDGVAFDGNFKELFAQIDVDALNSETMDFNINDWEHLTDTNHFILFDEQLKEYTLKLSWWLCRELLFAPEHTNRINIADISLPNYLYKSLKVFIYNSTVHNRYKIAYSLPTGAQLIIRFKDNSVLPQ